MQKVAKYLDYLIYWLIVSIPFSIAIAPAATNTFMVMLFLFFILKKSVKKERLFVNTPLNLPFLFFIIAAIISFKNSVDYSSSIRGIIKLLQAAFIFLICAEEIKDKKHIERIVLSMIFGVSLASLDALWQVKFGRDFIRQNEIIINIGLRRATAAFPDSNVLGVYLSAIAPLIIGLTFFYYKARRRLIMLFASALAVAGIALTFARGTALALYVSILFMSIAKRTKLLSLALVVILLIFPFIMPQSIKDWAKQVHYNPFVFMLNGDRITAFKNTVNMIKHHPLIGVGVNTFSQNYAKYKLPEPADERTSDFMYAHNNFLQMGGEIGLIGLGIFIWFLFILFKTNIYFYRNLKDEYYKIITLSIIACLVAFLINGLTETSLYYSRVVMIFWYLIGFSIALGRLGECGLSLKK